jgi:hypothetical protein
MASRHDLSSFSSDTLAVNLIFTLAGLPAVHQLMALTGPPQKQTESVSQSGFRLRPLENGADSK